MLRQFTIPLLLLVACDGGPTDPRDTAPPLVDADGDGYTSDVDCDDSDADVHPGAVETCDEIDNDGDGYIDDDDLEVEGRVTMHADADGDGYGSDDPTQIDQFCTQPDSGWVNDDSDCDDSDPDINPDGVESCNDLDDDCDGETDEGEIGDTWYRDSDGDGYGVGSVTTLACDQPSGFAAEAGDCDDDDPSISPGAVEVCNHVDDDCDGEIDEDTTPDTWYRDSDGDGYGTSGVTTISCGQPSGFAALDGDCDEDDPAINPGAREICNGMDDDCDTVVDGAGMVAFVASSGSSTDLSTTFAAGTASGAASYAISSSGTLYLCEGAYHAEVSVEAATVEIVGQDGSDLVSLVGDGSGSVITTTNGCAYLTVQGLSIEGGAATSGGCLDGGSHGVALTLHDLVLQSCSASDAGGGLSQVNGVISASDLSVSGCDGGSYGGGIYLQDLSGTITDIDLQGNQGSYGGGLLAVDSELTVEDADVFDNYASLGGGGLAVSGGALELNASLVWSNTAVSSSTHLEAIGGGAVVTDSGELSCTGSTVFTFGFISNSADHGGGAFLNGSASALSSDLCDWGGGKSDNDPDDVTALEAYQSYGSYGSDESFTCTGGEGCE